MATEMEGSLEARGAKTVRDSRLKPGVARSTLSRLRGHRASVGGRNGHVDERRWRVQALESISAVLLSGAGADERLVVAAFRARCQVAF